MVITRWDFRFPLVFLLQSEIKIKSLMVNNFSVQTKYNIKTKNTNNSTGFKLIITILFDDSLLRLVGEG